MENIAGRYEVDSKDWQALGHDVGHTAVTVILFALLMGFWAWLWVGLSF